MSIALAALLLVVMAVCSTGPGLLLLRRLRWTADEKICAAISLSLILTYLAATVLYLSGLSWNLVWLWTAMCIACLLLAHAELRRLWRRSHVRRQIAGFVWLFILCITLLSVIQHYSGGQWLSDWLLHYQRTIFFLKHQPIGTPLVTGDVIPSRPPMMNILAAFFMAHAGDGFDLFQIIFSWLNLLVFFPCVLLAGLLVKFGGRKVWLIAAMLSLNPMLLENSTWTWTKLFAAFFVLVSIAFYIRARHKNDPGRMIAAASAMAAALLVHYSAAPYAIAVFIHYIATIRHRSCKWTEIAAFGGAVIILLSSWFGWSLLRFGWQATVASNSSVADAEKLSFMQNVEKIGHNALATFVPHPLLNNSLRFRLEFEQPSRFGFARDYFFHLYQTNLTLSWGLLGWLGVAWLLIRDARVRDRGFWACLLLISIPLGIASVGSPDAYGLSHICLQPITLLGLCLIAGGWRSLPPWLRIGLMLGLAVDATLGIALQFRLEAHAMPVIKIGSLPVIQFDAATLNLIGVMNSVQRQLSSLTYWADHFAAVAWLPQLVAVVMIGGAIMLVSRSATIPVRILAMLIFTAGAVTCAFDDSNASLAAPPTASLAAERYRIGIDFYRQGQFDRARLALTDAFLLDPHNSNARYSLRLLLLHRGTRIDQTDAKPGEDVLRRPTDAAAAETLRQTLIERGLASP